MSLRCGASPPSVIEKRSTVTAPFVSAFGIFVFVAIACPPAGLRR